MNLRALHRMSARLIVLFACVHIANHLTSLASVQAHLRFMEAARSVYRLPAIETLLLLCLGFQALSGLWFVGIRRNQRHGTVAALQAASGSYLALFALVHVGAVMYGRSALGLDTNFYFAAAGFHVPPFQYFFAPYYFVAIVALFAHLGCAACRHLPPGARERALAVALPSFAGAVISSLIVLSLAGTLQPFEVPEKYLDTYARGPR